MDGLRFFAIFLVVINHFVIPLPQWAEFIRARGHLGVEIFFAVSGFLVMRSLHMCYHRNQFQNKQTLIEFYIRRALRIFFPYYTILIVISALALVVGSLRTKIASISDILWSFPIYFFNYAKSWTEGEVPGALNVMWSLAFEEQFYILLGLVFQMFRKKLSIALMALIVMSIGARFYTASVMDLTFQEFQFQTHIRPDAILWGCLLFLYWEPIKSFYLSNRWVRFPIFGGSFFAFYHGALMQTDTEISFSFLLSALFFTAMIIPIMCDGHSLLSKLLSQKILVTGGKVSYEVYLTHQIVNALLIKMGMANRPLIYTLSFIGASFTVASLYYFWVNRPVQQKLAQRLIKTTSQTA